MKTSFCTTTAGVIAALGVVAPAARADIITQQVRAGDALVTGVVLARFPLAERAKIRYVRSELCCGRSPRVGQRPRSPYPLATTAWIAETTKFEVASPPP